MLPGHPGHVFTPGSAVIPDVAPRVGFRIRIDDLAIKAGMGHAQPIIVPNHRGRVHYERYDIAVARLPHESHHAVIGVVEIDPLESVVAIILIPEGGFALVNVVEVLHERRRPSCRGSSSKCQSRL